MLIPDYRIQFPSSGDLYGCWDRQYYDNYLKKKAQFPNVYALALGSSHCKIII